MSEPNGNPYFEGLKAARRRTIYKGAGLDDIDLRKPHIGIVTFTETSPAYVHVRTLAEATKAGFGRRAVYRWSSAHSPPVGTSL